MNAVQERRIVVREAGPADREGLYRARHDVYAGELGQYEPRTDGTLPDAEGLEAVYLVALVEGRLAGFIGITPPDSPRFSVDRYMPRDALPVPVDNRLHEIRALTVLKLWRGLPIAAALMYAAFRWIEARGGTRIIAIGRREFVPMYLRAGLERLGPSFACGSVQYELMGRAVADLRRDLDRFAPHLDRLERAINWQLDVAFRRPPECFHGGAFFDAIGPGFDDLGRRHRVINADVLDAWYPPAPGVLADLREHLDWIARTSPPTRCEGLLQAIALARRVEPDCLLAGGGSSDLIFLALRQWLCPESRVLILDPMYGEYAHVVERLIRCRVERLTLDPAQGYRVDPRELARRLRDGVDFAIIVNPNNPTGLHLPRTDLEQVLRDAPPTTRFWIDETYSDYAGRDQSLETFAVRSRNVVVCKSMSKIYALSGLRVGYLCSSPHLLEDLRPASPPWAVSLPAQIAAVRALEAGDYYEARLRETHVLRAELARGLVALGITDIVPGIANFLLFELPPDGPDTRTVVRRCREQGLYLRDVANMGTKLGRHAIRIAVKDAATNARMLAILGAVLAHPVIGQQAFVGSP